MKPNSPARKSPKPLKGGRKKQFSERVLAPFKKGTLARIEKVRGDEEHRTAFIRVAVDNEISRRGTIS